MAGQVAHFNHVEPDGFIAQQSLGKSFLNASARASAVDTQKIQATLAGFPTHFKCEFKAFDGQIQINIAIAICVEVGFALHGAAETCDCVLEVVQAVFKAQYFGRTVQRATSRLHAIDEAYFTFRKISDIDLDQSRQLRNLMLDEFDIGFAGVVQRNVDIAAVTRIPRGLGAIKIDTLRPGMPQNNFLDLLDESCAFHGLSSR